MNNGHTQVSRNKAVEGTEIRPLPDSLPSPLLNLAEEYFGDDANVSRNFGRKYFRFEKPCEPGAAINIRGKYSEKREQKERASITSIPAIVPEDTPSFKFGATFKHQPGHYVVCWRITVLENFSITNGFRFSVNVTYDAEPDTKTTLDVVMSPEELERLEKSRAYDLELEALVVVQPYQACASNEREPNKSEMRGAQVEVIMSTRESAGCKYSGFQVDFVELRSFTGSHDVNVPTGSVPKSIVKKTVESRFTIDVMGSPVYRNLEKPRPNIPITRLAWSKDSTFLATLALWKNTAYITVWDMKYVMDPSNPPMDMSIVRRHCAVAVVKHPNPNGGDFSRLAIGLAISPKGDQVAIYQEPRIGQWADESKLDESEFRFCLFDNLLPKQHITVDIPRDMNINNSDGPSGGNASADDFQENGGGSISGASDLKQFYGIHSNELNRHTQLPHRLLKNFIGYGAFLTETENSYWEMNDIRTALSSNMGAEDRQDGDESMNKTKPDTRNGQSTLFVACNGIYIDIFKIKPGHKWEYAHTIRLTDLTPTLSRRITCKVMMDMISSNTFVWLEDRGLCCTIWDLQEGSNVSYVSSSENKRRGSSLFKGNSKIAISPDESMVAMASVDGILTTYYASTGIAINNREFTNHQIEYVAFHGQNNQLFVILRNDATLKLGSKILDPLQLDSEMQANQVPIPIIGMTILAFFHARGFKNKGFVFEADGSKINCYVSHDPVDNKVTRSENLVDCTERFYPPPKNDPKPEGEDELRERPEEESLEEESQEESQEEAREETEEEHKEDKLYEVRTVTHEESSEDGDGSKYWVHHVEVFEGNQSQHEKPVFSFVPEPWMRVSAAEIRQPQDLLKVYFLPGGKRFVVKGMQTLQIWNLPTDEDPDFSLVFIWSHPKRVDDPIIKRRGRKYKTELVGEYYHRIVDLKIYLDRATDNAVADIRLRDEMKLYGVRIPGACSSKTCSIYLHCMRSIHLLAAAYAYSVQWNKNSSKNSSQQTFTCEKHAQAIVQFTRGYINRLLSDEDFFPRQPTGTTPADVPQSDQEQGQEQKDDILPIASGNGLIPTKSATVSTTTSPPPRVLNACVDLSQVTNSNSKSAGIGFGLKNLLRQSPKDDDTRRLRVVTILTLLLDQHDLKNANHGFVEGLFATPNHNWIPHASMALNPIKRAIDIRNEGLLKNLIDYCMKCAKTKHLAYLEPVEKCLSDLLKRYPDIVAEIFMRASYIPAHDHTYVTSHAIDSRLTPKAFGDVFSGTVSNSGDDDDNDNLVFTLRSQLPITNTTLRRETKFPAGHGLEPLNQNRSRKMYVSPFQFQPVVSSIVNPYDVPCDDGESKESVFALIAGRDFFNSPAIVVSLLYKWNKFGRKYWLMHFFFVFVFFLLVVIITAQQISVSSSWSDSTPTPDELAARYLPEWRPVFMATIAMGFLLIIYELLQIKYYPSKYIRSPYNYVDLAAYISPVIGCFKFLNATPGTIAEDTGIDGGPNQIWIMGFGILFLYLNMLLELRVFRELGVVVNIIFNITRRIRWFLLVIGVFLGSFTHALLYVLHTARYRPCKGDSCAEPETSYPTGFWAALAETCFFLSGRYDPVGTQLETGSVGFQIMMLVFFFFTTILLLNILIAIMNDAFNASQQEGELAYLKLLSEVIAEVENHTMPNSARMRGDHYPKYIYYYASEAEAAKFWLKHPTFDDSSRFIAEKSTEAVSKVQTIQDTIANDIHALGDDIRTEMKQELADLRSLVKVLLLHSGATVPPERRASNTSRPLISRASTGTRHRYSVDSTN